MAIGRNPDARPQLDPAKDEEARRLGLKRIQIICDTPDDQPDDPDTPPITFFAYTEFIPKKGEIIMLQDRKRVQVQDVYYGIATEGETRFTKLNPWIYATLCRDEQKKD